MLVSLKLNVKLTWTDDRIRFQNLRKHFFQNKLSDDMATKIWIPQPIFANNHDRVAIEYMPSSSDIFLVRNGSSTEAPLSQKDEAKVYHPNETRIILRTMHHMKFKCQFNLAYFPFDYQICYAVVGSSKSMISSHCSKDNLFFYS